jgi:hypothetical protein
MSQVVAMLQHWENALSRLFRLNYDGKKSERTADDEQVFTIEHTGKTFHHQELSEKLHKAYELERWTCVSEMITGQAERPSQCRVLQVRP